METPKSTPEPPKVVNTNEWLKLLAEGKFFPLCRQLLISMDYLGQSTFAPLDLESRKRNDMFVNLFLFMFAHPTFEIPDEFADEFVKRNHLISNLVANSSFKNTDSHLEIIRQQPRNYVRILSLLSARNSVVFDRAAIFKVNPLLASLWYMQYSELFHAGFVTATACENLRRHFEFPAPEMVAIFNMQEPYFGSSYIHTPCERIAKASVNQSVKNAFKSLKLPATPRNPKKIAILSTHWRLTHSCYRICSAFIESLKPKYHLTFIQLGKYLDQHTAGFDEHILLESERGLPKVQQLLNNDYQMMIYPDIGMSTESVVLANVRLAPIQVCLLGHSVSTFGADVDYFVSGAQVETPDNPEKNYSERLILLPGMGCVHNLPRHKPKGVAKQTDRIVINCPWQTHKINREALLMLARLIKSSKRKIGFRFFIGGGTGLYNDYPPFYSEVNAILGPDHYQIMLDMPFEPYMNTMEQAHLSLDSWHFGGCNTVSDSLSLRIPIICREGERWYNRIGPQTLRLAGLPELIATSEDHYLDIAHRLIHDDPWRESLTERLKATDLENTIYTRSDAPQFANAMDYILENHDKLKASGDRRALRFPMQSP